MIDAFFSKNNLNCYGATEELWEVCSNVQPIKSLCMVPLDTAHAMDEETRPFVPVVLGTLGAPFTLWRWISRLRGCPPASHNQNYVHSMLQDYVEAQQDLIARQDCALCHVPHWRSAFVISAHAHVYGTSLRVHASYPPPLYLPSVPCY
jgi:hypothetical protein